VSTEQQTSADSRHSQLPPLLRQAVTSHEQGKLDAAYPLYREFVADNPKNPTALQLFGLLLSQLGQYEPAIKLMRESLSLFPDQAEVANNLGNALRKIGRVDEAIASYSDAIRISKDYVEAHRNQGLCYMQTGESELALSCFERCIEIRPTDAEARLAIGNLHRDTGDLDSAIANFEKALELQPNYAEAHHNLGVCLRLKQRPQAALEHYEAAKALGLERAELHHNIANAFIDMQKVDPAVNAYRSALQKNPMDIDTHRNLNSLLWQQDMLDDHLKSYRDALESTPEAIELRLAYANSLSQKDAHEEAEKVLREGLQFSAESSAFKSQLAYTMEGQGRWDEALAMHASAVKTADAAPNHLVSYGRALLAQAQPDDALRQIQAAAALTPFNQRALAYLGLCWRMLDDERDAVLNDYDNFVQVYDIPVPSSYVDIAEFNQQLISVLDPLHIGKRHPAEQTLRGGSQTSGDLFDRHEPEIAELAKSLRECIWDYIGRFPQNDQHPLLLRRSSDFDFSASWSVRLGRNGYHTMHTHPLGWISSAYYVQVPAEVADSDEHGGGLKFGEPDIDIGEKGEARRKIQPAAGRLALFPSYMWHGTVPFESDDPRMTVAFDVTPR
jgi:uncharacterized protein (TIGR02466 family)